MPEHNDLVRASPPHREPDDVDPKEYAHRVVDPYWLGGTESRVRHALAQAGFEVSRLVTNPDGSMVTFWLTSQIGFNSVAEARARLMAEMRSTGLPCEADDLTLDAEGEGWSGAYVPPLPNDPDNPVAFIAQHFRQNPAQEG